MKVNIERIRKMRKDNAWSQEELATASGLNLRTIQRIEKEATASLQSMKALASVFDVNIRDLEHEESTMLNELLGKEVTVVMGMKDSKLSGFDDNVKGKVEKIEATWLKLVQKDEPVYINVSQIKRIIPQ